MTIDVVKWSARRFFKKRRKMKIKKQYFSLFFEFNIKLSNVWGRRETWEANLTVIKYRASDFFENRKCLKVWLSGLPSPVWEPNLYVQNGYFKCIMASLERNNLQHFSNTHEAMMIFSVILRYAHFITFWLTVTKFSTDGIALRWT